MLALLVLAQILGVANANLIAVALPPLAAELGASGTQQQWIVDVYVLVYASLLVPAGVLADRHGRRRSVVVGLLVFALASLACAVATSPGVLIAARVVQGLGPPLILPASLALITTAYADRQARARAIGMWGAGSGLGVAAGPILGGVLVAALGWRAAFAFNVPAALLLAVLLLRAVAPDRVAAAQEAGRARFDVTGAVLATVAVAAVVFACIEGPERGWASPEVVVAGVAAVLLLAAFVTVERRHPQPLVDLALLREPVFATANLAAATLLFTLLPLTVYVSSFLQGFRAATPLQAGAALVPLVAAVALAAGISGRLTSRFAPRAQVTGGLLVAAAGALLLSRIDVHAGSPAFVAALLLYGIGSGIALPATTATAVAAVAAARTGMASAVHNAGRQLGSTFGIAVLGSIVLARAGDERSAADYAAGLSLSLTVAALCLCAAAALAVTVMRPTPRRSRTGTSPRC